VWRRIGGKNDSIHEKNGKNKGFDLGFMRGGEKKKGKKRRSPSVNPISCVCSGKIDPAQLAANSEGERKFEKGGGGEKRIPSLNGERAWGGEKGREISDHRSSMVFTLIRGIRKRGRMLDHLKRYLQHFRREGEDIGANLALEVGD